MSNPLAEPLGRTIRVLRADAAMERAELADRAGISYSYLAAIESGKRHPSAPVLRRIAAALGVRGHELMGAAEARLDEPDGSRRALWLGVGAAAAAIAQEPPRRRDTDRAQAELDALIPSLDGDDLELLLQLARKLAARH